MFGSQVRVARSLALLLPFAAGCRDSRADTTSSPPPRAPEHAVATQRIEPAEPLPLPPLPRTVLISAVGDCTLATEFGMSDPPGSFPGELKDHGGDLRYPFSGVLSVLAADDLTIANLETTLTTVGYPAIPGRPRFRGKPEYTAILTAGSVEVVNIANNHSYDFGFTGYDETVRVVRAAGIGVSGNEFVDERVVKGVAIVTLGFTGGDPVVLPRVIRDVTRHKTDANLVIVSFHWGAEGWNETNGVQRTLGRAAVDAGADLVLGSHPHVLQGIEEYGGKHIVYSLGNFVFGGHSNPADKDSMIYQETFSEKDGRYVSTGNRIIPVRISTAVNRNDYRPVLLEGEEAARVLERVRRYSDALSKLGAAPDDADD